MTREAARLADGTDPEPDTVDADESTADLPAFPVDQDGATEALVEAVK